MNVILYLLNIPYQLVPTCYVNCNYTAAGIEYFMSFTHLYSNLASKKGYLLNVASKNSNPTIRYQKGTVNSKASFPNTLYVPYPLITAWYRKKIIHVLQRVSWYNIHYG